MPPRKKKTIAPAREPEIEPVIESEELPEVQPPVIQKDTFTFKVSHFYAVLTVLAFAAGVLIGYVAWGYNTPQTVLAPAQTAPPPEPRVYSIDTKGYPSLGPEKAPIVIVEFSDYQCPYCYRWHVQVYQNLLAAYPGKIRFVYRNFPLSFHQNAFASAEAALCAGDQDAYWKFHDVLFDNQAALNNQAGTTLDQATYNQYARDLGLDVTAFETCMTTHKYQKFITDDANYANGLPADTNGEAAVGGTPTFFVNGHRLGGAYPIEYFKQIIDAELAKLN
ncbi:MAG TPA: thioredoxin domain-containing protein [Anaerolineales bacterium]|nr:thioredoxin domain-containing protein [Anaerolineales bacterium]HLO28544.1 thioredoxin domain-containing protein [Anaerolineales bacterium]